MHNARIIEVDEPLIFGALLPFIPKLCELVLLKAWIDAHIGLMCPGSDRYTTVDPNTNIEQTGIEDDVRRCLDLRSSWSVSP